MKTVPFDSMADAYAVVADVPDTAWFEYTVRSAHEPANPSRGRVAGAGLKEDVLEELAYECWARTKTSSFDPIPGLVNGTLQGYSDFDAVDVGERGVLHYDEDQVLLKIDLGVVPQYALDAGMPARGSGVPLDEWADGVPPSDAAQQYVEEQHAFYHEDPITFEAQQIAADSTPAFRHEQVHELVYRLRNNK